MIKFATIGAYKNAINRGDATADVELRNGDIVALDVSDGVKFTKTGVADAVSANTVKELFIVMTVNDQPEFGNLVYGKVATSDDFRIPKGGKARGFLLGSLSGHSLELNGNDIAFMFDGSVAEGDKLTVTSTGKLKKASEVSAVDGYFKVEKVSVDYAKITFIGK